MSYDIYCYHSELGRPDLEEAQTAIASLEEFEDEGNAVVSTPGLKQRIATALIDYNPRLESFDFDYDEIAKLQGTTSDEAKEIFDHIELNTPEGDLATQITIFENTVVITIPYWYSGDQSEDVFTVVSDYTKIIRQTAGYFVYDPQTENVYDPLIRDITGLEVYQEMTGQIAGIKSNLENKAAKKSWWKFW